MKWRVSLSIIVDDEETVRRLYDFLKKHRLLMRTIRRGEPNEEKSVIMLERHYHNEDPTRPCEVVESFESE